MATIIICLILLVIVGFALFIGIKGLIGSLKGFHGAAKIFLKQPGASEAYGILTDAAEHGEIPDSAIDEAIEVMLKNGASHGDIIQFIQYVCTETGLQAERAYRRMELRGFTKELGKTINRISNM
ncbi:MAG: hypothetical protein Q4C31_03125 [Eubacteriales bacterium]|nr:hypothetical protein [Eubacteriales bacterium]